VWHRLDFLAGWMLLGADAWPRVYGELLRSRQPSVWQFGLGDILLIGSSGANIARSSRLLGGPETPRVP